MHILVCGFGSIGRKHASNALKMGHRVSVWRSRSNLVEEIIESGFQAIVDLGEAIRVSDLVVVATSTDQHLDILRQALVCKKPVYLEKPVSHSMDGVEEILALSKGVPVQMGCQLRQHPCLKKLKHSLETHEYGEVLAFQLWVGQLLSQWRSTNYRDSYSSNGSRGGGALTDLVHELDLVKWLVGEVSDVSADLRNVGSLPMSDAEDLANLILIVNGRHAGTVQLDMVSPFWRRGGQIVCEKCLYEWDLRSGSLWITTEEGKALLHQVEESFATQDMLYEHLKTFIEGSAEKRMIFENGLESGIEDLRVIAAAKRSARNGSFAKL